MRLAMLGWEFPPFISGGLGVHCYELTRRLADRGHSIDFFMPVSGKSITSPHPSIRLIEVSPTVLKPYFNFTKKGKLANYGEGLLKAVEVYNLLAAKMVADEHAKNPYALVHAHDWLTAPGAALAAHGGAATPAVPPLHLPYVQTFHSTEFDRTSTPWDAIVRIERSAAADSDLVIAVSNRTREQLVSHLGASRAKISVVYNGVDAARYARNGPKPALSVQTDGKCIVLFLGRLTEQKGPVQFLHAAKKVLEKRSDVLFFIGGSGELLPLLIALSLELGLSDHVRFLGFLSDEDQKRIYSAADVYVMPSTSEPFGITALEAMASGTPIIISKTSGVGEVVKSALKVDFWDIQGMAAKMLAVLEYAPLRNSMVRMAPADLDKLTWEKCAQETEAVYSEAVSKYKNNPSGRSSP